jgi:aspartate racemase
MIDVAKNLEKAGADMIVICTNTMHKMADDVQNEITIPLLHIADATAESIQEHGMNKVGLLGTRFTMEQDFYKTRLSDKYGMDVITPGNNDMDIVHKIIYDELCLGRIVESSKQQFLRIIENLVDNGAEGIILGCTEIPLLVKQTDVSVPIFDTTNIHAERAVLEAIKTNTI